MGSPMPTELIKFVSERYATMTVAEITVAWNSLGARQLIEQQIKSICGNHGIKSGRDGRIKKGSVSWNKGKKGYMGANRTSFKKGNLPHNHKSLWSERIDTKDGYIYISVPETNPHTGFHTRFKQKHVWVWEQANGPVPKGSVIIFADCDIYNLAIENLLCITRNKSLLLNLHKYKDSPAEIRPSILALAKIEAAAGFRTMGRVHGAGRKRKEAV